MYRDTVTNPRFISFCVISARYFRNKQFQGLNSKQDRQKSPTLPFRNLTLLTLRSKILKVAHIKAVLDNSFPELHCSCLRIESQVPKAGVPELCVRRNLNVSALQQITPLLNETKLRIPTPWPSNDRPDHTLRQRANHRWFV